MVCDKVRPKVEGLKGWRRISRDTENGKKSRHSMKNSNNDIILILLFDFDFVKICERLFFSFFFPCTHGNVIHVIHV